MVLNFLLALSLFLFFLIRKQEKDYENTPLPPGPRGLPLIGNLHQIDSSAPHVYYCELSKKYGPLVMLRLGFRPTLVVSSEGWNVFLAGRDTSSVAIVRVMTFLMKNPRSMKRAQEEVRNLFGKKGFADENDVQSLVYLKAVVKETFRLQPVVPLLIPRETIRKCNIGNYEIPAKPLVYVSASAIGREPEVWENPESFYPERFLGSSIDYRGLDFEWISFDAGRRRCPGITMGTVVVELALAKLLYKFHWEMPDGMIKEDLDLDVNPDLTMSRKNDLC
ncbi:cytochrome P450 71D10-like [Herrania umbratica]|uniref:Cytochrome P450 71D10-like n=1 Tax=Herrania umbratica TaxID=108875 RepID=A0A6J1AC29_9ROSI|nr:cytochrome P450 71D10-like [Herrania umbratica]